MSGTSRAARCKIALICATAITLALVAFPAQAFASSRPATFKTGTVVASAEQDFLNRTNALRASLGLPALRSNSELVAKARGWSQTQAASGTIFHSNLSDGVTQNWYRLGENVGMGPDVASIHDALVHSPRHYENLVDGGFTEVGIGVVQQGNTIYVTEEFMQFMPSSGGGHTSTTTAPPTHTTTHSTPRKTSSGNAAANNTPTTPVAENAPLPTASPDLNAVFQKISALEA
jgi:hypothetical protein